MVEDLQRSDSPILTVEFSGRKFDVGGDRDDSGAPSKLVTPENNSHVEVNEAPGCKLSIIDIDKRDIARLPFCFSGMGEMLG